MYYVYILQSRDSSKYIGVSKDLRRKLEEHNRGTAKYSRSKLPFKLIWYCAFPNKQLAYNFEKYLKSSSGYAFTKKHLI